MSQWAPWTTPRSNQPAVDPLSLLMQEAAGDWTAQRVCAMIDGSMMPSALVERMVRYMADKPHLWNVSDDEFIAAVAVVNREAAGLFRTPAGLAFLHRMSAEIAERMVIEQARQAGKSLARLFGIG